MTSTTNKGNKMSILKRIFEIVAFFVLIELAGITILVIIPELLKAGL